VVKPDEMQDALTLPYARVHRSRRRVLISVAMPVLLCAVASGLIYGAYRRVTLLQHDARIGPVDWGAVLTSPTLLKAAWRLSTNPGLAKPRPYGAGGIRFAGDPNDTSVSVSSFRHTGGRLEVDVSVENVGDEALIIPAITKRGRIQRWVGWCHFGKDDAMISTVPALGAGVRVLDPGESATLAVSFPAPRQPCTDIITLITFRAFYRLRIDAGDNRLDPPEYTAWDQLPDDAVSVDEIRRYYD
jgi:hypothetical protein